MAPAERDGVATVEDRFARFQINPRNYQWSIRLFSVIRRMLSVQVNLHDPDDYANAGSIFLFNHFSRFETFIPQYLLNLHTGAYSRAVASAEFFDAGDSLGNFLASVGAVANNTPGLLPFLAAEILRGRKIVVFPEGGMVKDRRVVDDCGNLGVFSRSAGERRKHHSGAAVLAMVLDAFKAEVRYAERHNDYPRLDEWANGLGIGNADDLVARASQSTLIVPANITFFPLRVDDNLLRRGASLVNRGLSRRATEELLIEGNLLLRDTDMDIRFGEPLASARFWGRLDRKLMARIAHKVAHLDDFFALERGEGWQSRLLATRMRRTVLAMRNEYMRRMYAAVTVNLCHIAATVIVELLDEAVDSIEAARFAAVVHAAIKRLQREADVHLHNSIDDPRLYRDLPDGSCAALDQFIAAITAMSLIHLESGRYVLQPKLREEHDFDVVRLENLALVYANEAEPILGVRKAVRAAVHASPQDPDWDLSLDRFDDELRAWRIRRARFAEARFAELNARETATESGAPYLLIPDAPKPTRRPSGVVLVHGFLASPAEMRPLAEALFADGHVVLGARLAGHGTSPWDLHERPFEDWLASVARAEAIMEGLVERFVTVGFSTGGALALIQTRKSAGRRAATVGVNVPVRFADPRMKFVSLIAAANRMIGRISSSEGILPFNPNQSAHPEVNYASIPLHGLRELLRASKALLDTGDVAPKQRPPIFLMQSDQDPVVDPESLELLRDVFAAAPLTAQYLPSDHHSVIYDDSSGCWSELRRFLASVGLPSN